MQVILINFTNSPISFSFSLSIAMTSHSYHINCDKKIILTIYYFDHIISNCTIALCKYIMHFAYPLNVWAIYAQRRYH